MELNLDAMLTPEAYIPAPERGPRILARTFYRELQAQGFTHDQILAFASEMIYLVTADMESAQTLGLDAK